MSAGILRRKIAFRDVNVAGTLHHDPALQRHHLLPRQLLNHRQFGPMIRGDVGEHIGFDDFRANGLLLPARDSAVLRMGLPLHRGPHRRYNGMVMDRVEQIERRWHNRRELCPRDARIEAVMRLRLLQSALRRCLLSGSKRVRLNRFDPLGQGINFTDLDAMADALWGATSAVD